MKRNPVLTLTALAALSAPAFAQTPAVPAAWNAAALSSATYVILDPKIEGNANLISGDQQAGVLAAMKRDSAGAIVRHYPNAKIASDLNTPNAIKVTPIISAPSSLVPWAKMSAKMNLQLPDGNQVSLVEDFSVLMLWQQQSNAANFAFDQLAKKMP